MSNLLCPVCGDVELDLIVSGDIYSRYTCKNCGFDGVYDEFLGRFIQVKDNCSLDPEWLYNNKPNQAVKADDGKLKLTLVPHQIIRDIAEVRMYGNAKYPDGGPDNWKKVEPQRYRDALYRHLLLYLEDPHGVDEESGLRHIAHIACNVAFLCEFEAEDSIGTSDKESEVE